MPDDSWIDNVTDEPDAVNDTIPWRRRLPKWSIEWRDRWGHRANELEDQGLNWIEAERQAWNETIAEKKRESRQVESPTPGPLAVLPEFNSLALADYSAQASDLPPMPF